eukprot:evm.model.scf_2237.4 EVM.evm.TU.scf_2237.4   scf_2237:20914-24602(+)
MAAAARGNKDEPRLLGLLFASSGEADMTLGTEVQVSGSGDTPTAETPPGSIAGHGGMRQFSGLADGGDDEAGGRRRSREEAVREALGRDDGLLMRALARDRAGGAVGREGAGAADRGAGARGEGGKEGMTLGCLALRLPGAEDPEPKAGERRRSVEVCSPPPRAPRAGGGRGRFLEGELGDPEPDGDSNSSDGEFDRAPDSGLVLSRPNAKAGGGGVWALFGGPAGREGAAGVGREDEKDDGKSAKLFYSPPAGPREAKSKPAQRRRRAARPAAPKGPIAIPAPVAIAGPRCISGPTASPGPNPTSDADARPGPVAVPGSIPRLGPLGSPSAIPTPAASPGGIPTSSPGCGPWDSSGSNPVADVGSSHRPGRSAGHGATPGGRDSRRVGPGRMQGLAEDCAGHGASPSGRGNHGAVAGRRQPPGDDVASPGPSPGHSGGHAVPGDWCAVHGASPRRSCGQGASPSARTSPREGEGGQSGSGASGGGMGMPGGGQERGVQVAGCGVAHSTGAFEHGPREGLCPPGADGGVAGSAEGGVYVVVNGRGESGMDGGIGEDEEAAGSAPLGPGSRTWGAELGRVAVGTAAVAWEAAPSSGGKVDGGLHDAEYDPIKKTSSRTGSPSHRPEPPPLSNNPFRRAGLIPPDPGPLPRADALDSPDCLDDPVMLTPRDTVHHAAIMNRLSTSTPTPSVASSAENNPIGREPDRYANPLGASPLRIAAGLEEDWTPMSDPIMAVRGRGDAAVAPIAWPQAAGDAIEDPGTDPNRNSAGMIDEDGGINRRHALSTFRADVVVPETRSSWDSGGAWDPPRDAESASGSRHAVYSFAFVAAPGVPTQEAALRDSSTPIGGRDREAVIDGGGEGEDAGPGGGEGSPSPEGGVAWGPAGRPAEEAAASGPADTPNLSMCERRLLVPGSPSWESDDRPEYHPSAAPIGLYGGANRGRASFGVPGDRRDSVNRRARHRRTSCELETNPNLKMKECVGLLEQRRASGAVSRAVGGVRQRSLRALRRLCWRA